MLLYFAHLVVFTITHRSTLTPKPLTKPVLVLLVYPFIIRPNPFITSASAITCASVEDDGFDGEGVGTNGAILLNRLYNDYLFHRIFRRSLFLVMLNLAERSQSARLG